MMCFFHSTPWNGFQIDLSLSLYIYINIYIYIYIIYKHTYIYVLYIYIYIHIVHVAQYPTQGGLGAMREYLETRSDKSISSNSLCDLANINLKNNMRIRS